MNVQPITLHLNNFGGNETAYARAGRVGSFGIPLFANVAAPADGAQVDAYDIEATVTGVVCAECSSPTDRVRHATTAHVRACNVLRRELAADMAAEARIPWL